MENQTVPVSGESVINVQMKENAIGVDEVVVTAMGITRSEKSLGYSVSTVKADEINKAREGNVLNALAGKVAGVNISAASGTAGGGSRIIIRGPVVARLGRFAALRHRRYAVSNQSYNPTGINGSVDVGNRMGDISGDDIESINVLERRRRNGPLRCPRQGRRYHHHDQERFADAENQRNDQLDAAFREHPESSRFPEQLCRRQLFRRHLQSLFAERLGPQDRRTDRPEFPGRRSPAESLQKQCQGLL